MSLCHYMLVFWLQVLSWPLLIAFCVWQCHARTWCFIHCCVLHHLLCDSLPFNISLTCRRAAYPRLGICECFWPLSNQKAFIYNLSCSLQHALQCCSSFLHRVQDLHWLGLNEGATSCAGRKSASAAGAVVGMGWCFTHEVTQGFHFPLVLCFSQHIEIVLPGFGSAASHQPKSPG